jgi:hypothetical protein
MDGLLSSDRMTMVLKFDFHSISALTSGSQN